jgi:hypothetical protein
MSRRADHAATAGYDGLRSQPRCPAAGTAKDDHLMACPGGQPGHSQRKRSLNVAQVKYPQGGHTADPLRLTIGLLWATSACRCSSSGVANPMTHHQADGAAAVDSPFVREPSYSALTSLDAAPREDLGAYRARSTSRSRSDGPSPRPDDLLRLRKHLR